MPRKRQLTCIELRVHLCPQAQKCTGLCSDCGHPCPAGTEYKERFLFRNAPTRVDVSQKKLEALVSAYVKRKQESALLSAMIPLVSYFGIYSTRQLRDEWNRHYKEMCDYANAHALGEYFVPRGRLTDEQRSVVYAQRVKDYDAMRASGMTWEDVAKREGCNEAAVRQRYATAKHFLEKENEIHEVACGIYHY